MRPSWVGRGSRKRASSMWWAPVAAAGARTAAPVAPPPLRPLLPCAWTAERTPLEVGRQCHSMNGKPREVCEAKYELNADLSLSPCQAQPYFHHFLCKAAATG